MDKTTKPGFYFRLYILFRAGGGKGGTKREARGVLLDRGAYFTIVYDDEAPHGTWICVLSPTESNA